MSRERIVVRPGSADDPDRAAHFRAIQTALAGANLASALAAQIDSLACSICVAASDRENATRIIESTMSDLQKAVADNWDLVRSQIVDHAPGGTA